MQKLPAILLLLLFALPGCREDRPPPLQCDLSHPLLVCREEAYSRGQFIGYIDYSYREDGQLSSKVARSIYDGYLAENFEYNDKSLITKILHFNREGKLQEEQQFAHTAFDSISSISIFRDGSLFRLTTLQYNADRVLVEKLVQGDAYFERRQYVYDDAGLLYKEEVTDAGGTIQQYFMYKNYLNGITKIYAYDSVDNLLNIKVLVSNSQGQVQEIRSFSSNYTLLSSETFTYQQQLLVKQAIINDGVEVSFRLYQYP